MLIVAVDPGATTGVAFSFTYDGKNMYETLTITDRRELYDFLSSNKTDTVVCEQFVTSNIHSHRYGILTVEIVGGVEAVCHLRNIPFVRRSPNQRAPFQHKAKEYLQSRKESYVDHQEDALAHLIGWEKHIAKTPKI